jgi:hypothetical protein
VWDWQVVGIATGSGCEDPAYPGDCPEDEEPPPETLPDFGVMGQNPWNCRGHTEYPHKSGFEVSVHAWSECGVSVPEIRASSALQKWSYVYWNTHNNVPTTARQNHSFIDVNPRSGCTNGLWRGISGHSIRGPDGFEYGLLTAARADVSSCIEG